MEAVTTLGAGDLHLTEELVDALNSFLADRDDTALQAMLDRVPKPVCMAARQYLKDKCAPKVGAFTECGPIDIVRTAVYFSRLDDEIEDYLDGAYMIGLGIRMSNERDSDGDIGWVIQLRSDEVTVPANAEPRTWALPTEVKLLETWTSKQPLDDLGPVRGALKVAGAASAEGRRVRVHTLLHSDRDVDFEGNGTSEFVVDVFDAPIPHDSEE
ncbi:Maf-like protein [Embleya scabrispora]|uniref:Maf-like protein n=1 Tax=Embleya scabrispora TaxID=159449 RepID=UPI00117BFE01|nr:Maf-like protein [Embleya scabrispora]